MEFDSECQFGKSVNQSSNEIALTKYNNYKLSCKDFNFIFCQI